MASEAVHYLPRILSVFYAAFDVNKGPKIVYQVPDGLITSPAPATSSSPAFGPLPDAILNRANSRTSSSSAGRSSRPLVSPSLLASPYSKRLDSSSATLFSFEDISRYVIPQSPLCGRLVICATRKHRIIGFPVELYGSQYERNYFRYNVCFVFDRHADLRCYEPIVRKIARVLTACEEESSFLSSPETYSRMQGVLEQLYEDLNTTSETSILIDKFNSIELKIFPLYSNPPAIHDWDVPLALIDFNEKIEEDWDLAIAVICPFIDGVNHVLRIAELANCDLDIAREAISHLLYYKVITIIDIFQYSNVYALSKLVQWNANDAERVMRRCGMYVTKPNSPIPDWPQLLNLYSKLGHGNGKTVLDWMRECNVQETGIDPRRFVVFGVIMGLIRRVHRWPVFITESAFGSGDGGTVVQEKSHLSSSSWRPFRPSISTITSSKGDTSNNARATLASHSLALNEAHAQDPTSTNRALFSPHKVHGGRSSITPAQVTVASESTHVYAKPNASAGTRPRRANTLDMDVQGSVEGNMKERMGGDDSAGALRYGNRDASKMSLHKPEGGRRHAQSLIQQPLASHSNSMLRRENSDRSESNATSGSNDNVFSIAGSSSFNQAQLSTSPSSSSHHSQRLQGSSAMLNSSLTSKPTSTRTPSYPSLSDLKPLLDGTHNTDELGVMFGVGWKGLEGVLRSLELERDERGLGGLVRVVVLYR